MIGLELILDLMNIQYKDLAEELSLNKQNITNWIRKHKKIPKKYLKYLSEKFNISDYLLQKELTELEHLEIRKKILSEVGDEKYKESLIYVIDEAIEKEKLIQEIENDVTSSQIKKKYYQTLKTIFESLESEESKAIRRILKMLGGEGGYSKELILELCEDIKQKEELWTLSMRIRLPEVRRLKGEVVCALTKLDPYVSEGNKEAMKSIMEQIENL